MKRFAIISCFLMTLVAACGAETNNKSSDPTQVADTSINTRPRPADGGLVDAACSRAACMLTARPSTGYRFVQWEGDVVSSNNPLTLDKTRDYNMTAVFTMASVEVSGHASSSAGGTVEVTTSESPPALGGTAEFTATANEGYMFTHWTGDLGGSDNPTVVTIDGDIVATAHFVSAPTLNGPSVVESGSYSLDWTASWFGPSNRTERVVLEESTEGPMGSFYELAATARGDVSTEGVFELTDQPLGTFYYRVVLEYDGARHVGGYHVVIREPGAKQITIINDLAANAPVSEPNTIISIQIARTASELGESTEQLTRGFSPQEPGELLETESQRTFTTGHLDTMYYIRVKAGYWKALEFWPYIQLFEKSYTEVWDCDGSTQTYKEVDIPINDHAYDTREIHLSEFLPHYDYLGSPFCQ